MRRISKRWHVFSRHHPTIVTFLKLAALQFATDTWFDWAVLLAGGCASIWLGVNKAPPGYAIGALAVVAAIMTFSRPKALQRLCVIALAVGLLLLEYHAINSDRADQAREHIAELTAQAKQHSMELRDQDAQHQREQGLLNQQLDKILSDNRLGMKGILDKSQSIESQTSKNLNLTRLSIETMRGSKSIPIFHLLKIDENTFALNLENTGESALSVNFFTHHISGAGKMVFINGSNSYQAMFAPGEQQRLPFYFSPNFTTSRGKIFVQDDYDLALTTQFFSYFWNLSFRLLASSALEYRIDNWRANQDRVSSKKIQSTGWLPIGKAWKVEFIPAN